MHFKLIVTLVDEEHTNAVVDAARRAGATGATVLNQARGEGAEKHKTFMGLDLSAQRDMLIFLVEEHLSRSILETIAAAGEFDEKSTGIAFQVDVEDAVGLERQVERLIPVVEKII